MYVGTLFVNFEMNTCTARKFQCAFFDMSVEFGGTGREKEEKHIIIDYNV